MKLVLVLVLAAGGILVGGCAAKVVATTDRTVIVNAGSQDAVGSLQSGDTECAKRGLKARLKSLPNSDRTWVFDCVP